MQEKVQVI